MARREISHPTVRHVVPERFLMAAEIDNRLGKLRRARGQSAAQLAKAVGVSRQTVHAIEAGNYIPNAVVALRLARALDTGVEDLFRLAEDGVEADPRIEKAMFLSHEGDLEVGRPVQLGRVGKKLIASLASPFPCYLPAADALVMNRARVRLIRPESLENRVIVSGCDPGISVLARHAQVAGIELIPVHRNSSQSLELLKKGCVHVAGSHLLDGASEESNLPQIGKMFPKKSIAVISFAWWEEGIVTAPNNPKSIQTVEDLARPNVSIVNREKGAGARLLLDRQLALSKMAPLKVRGYRLNAQGHLDAAWQVAKGVADCCIATRAAAQSLGLGFIPLARERYDLAIAKRDLSTPAIETLFDIVNRAAFRKELATLGYETGASGRRML